RAFGAAAPPARARKRCTRRRSPVATGALNAVASFFSKNKRLPNTMADNSGVCSLLYADLRAEKQKLVLESDHLLASANSGDRWTCLLQRAFIAAQRLDVRV